MSARRRSVPSENLRAGRDFSAVRRKPEPRPRRPGERAARALIYVKGPTPLHLPLTSYSHFNGTTWREEPCCNQNFPAEQEPSGSWLQAGVTGRAVPRRVRRPPGQDRDARIEPDADPGPPGPLPRRQRQPARLLRLGAVRDHPDDRPHGAGGDGHRLRVADGRPGQAEGRSRCPPGGIPAKIINSHSRASTPSTRRWPPWRRAWVAGLPEGWVQVEAVIAALRQGYTRDPFGDGPARLHRRRRRVLASLASRTRLPVRLFGGRAAPVAGLPDSRRQRPVRGAGALRPPDAAHAGDRGRRPLLGRGPAAGRALGRRRAHPRLRADAPGPPWSDLVARALAIAWRWARGHAGGLLAAAAAIGVLTLRRRDRARSAGDDRAGPPPGS